MDTWIWIVIVVAAVIVVGVVAAAVARRRKTAHLQDRFGSEYDRTVDEAGGRRDAERELADREKRREQLDVRPLSDAARNRYADEWQAVQARFVDDPPNAVREADALVQRVMGDRGYPVDEDFERRAADVSVDHPDVVANFREGHRLYTSYDSGDGDTEDLRQAMRHYRALFDELLEREPAAEEARR